MKIYEILQNDLTSEQYEAAIDSANEVLCLACAGSGKSTTLAYRIARLLAEGESPESLVAITFTEKAAESIKLKVAKTLPKVGLSPELLGAMFIGTVHSFGRYLLGELDALYRQFEVLDQNRFILYLISRYGEIGIHRLRSERNANYFQTIKAVSDAWSQLNNEALSAQDIEIDDSTLSQVLTNIHNCLQRDQFIDYSLMLRIIVDAIENKDPRIERATKQLKHIMVDEYQDTYPLQDKLFRGLHKNTQTLFVVGDDDQAIYGWNGADVSNIMNFSLRFPNANSHTLSINFRSTNLIVDSTSGFIHRQLGSQRMTKNPQAYASNNSEPTQLGKFFFDSRNEEADWIADRIQSLLGKAYNDKGQIRGLSPADFAILMKSTLSSERDGQPRHAAFTNALRARGIEPYIESEGSIFDYNTVQVLKESFDLLRDNNLSREILQNFYDNRILTAFPNANFDTVSSVLSAWQRDIHQPGRRKVKPQQLVHDILEAFNIAHTEFSEMEMHSIGQFSKIMNDVESVYFSIDTTARFHSILNFLSYLANPITSDDYEANSRSVLQRPNAVFISTIHKAKGLEFPVVFVVDVQSGRFPGKRKSFAGWLPQNIMQFAINRGAYQNNREGEIRLFYTAITRAERYLYISGCMNLPGGIRSNNRSVFEQDLLNDSITDDPIVLPNGLINIEQVPRVDENVMPTSFSEIRYYLNCPKNYQFRKIYGFNPIVPDLYGYGLTIHTAIGKLHQEYSDETPSIQEVEKITRDTFHLKHVPPSNDPINNPGPYERGLEKAVEVVRQYVEDYGNEFKIARQVEQRFEIPASQTIISGAIDLLVKEDPDGNIIEVNVIDFKSMSEPEDNELLDWIDLSLQVQLYAKAANEVLGHNSKTGAVHLLRDNIRIHIPITDEAISAAIKNIEWGVDKIISGDFPMRPEQSKCELCDFKALCSKIPEQFTDSNIPPPIHIPFSISEAPLLVKAFSQFTNIQ
ncbi:MAG TPA: ATP-dependent DNA helicase [Saprospiraceae bacterium]|nr:ATP-dependent DNA helicase [Saprospiraceae bacterium]